jgi:hypothetical protein
MHRAAVKFFFFFFFFHLPDVYFSSGGFEKHVGSAIDGADFTQKPWTAVWWIRQRHGVCNKTAPTGDQNLFVFPLANSSSPPFSSVSGVSQYLVLRNRSPALNAGGIRQNCRICWTLEVCVLN